MINWQLSKQDIRWPVSPDRTAGSSVDPSTSSTFLKLSADKVPVSNNRRLKSIFSNDSHEICFVYVTIKILISNCPRTRKFSQLFKNTSGEDLFLSWSRSTSNFCTLIGQNLTGEFMRKIYAASWKLFTLTAKADRGLCQLVVFLTVFFHWMYKMKYSCYQESSVIHAVHGWFVYWVFGWEMRRLSKLSNPISDGIVFVFHLAQCVRGFKTLKPWLWPSLISFRNWISNGKPE